MGEWSCYLFGKVFDEMVFYCVSFWIYILIVLDDIKNLLKNVFFCNDMILLLMLINIKMI